MCVVVVPRKCRNLSVRKTLHKTLTWGLEAMVVVEVAFTKGVKSYGRDVAISYGD